VLASAVRRVAAGAGAGLVMVLGEAGIGKTALLAVAGGLAQGAGIRTFRAAGAPLERDFGYGVVRQFPGGCARPVRVTPTWPPPHSICVAKQSLVAVLVRPDRRSRGRRPG
jgi:hypothetical protein